MTSRLRKTFYGTVLGLRVMGKEAVEGEGKGPIYRQVGIDVEYDY